MKTWIIDKNNNSASVEHWGSEEKARASLATLTDCCNCCNCSNCSNCARCSDCCNCWNCWNCWNCSDCSDCLRCCNCSDCFDCFDCSGETSKFDVPRIDNIHQAIFAAASAPGALNMGSWHACKTTHCRAGWCVVLAGKAGRKLEKETSTMFAAMQIYKASGYPISPCRFFDSNKDAMADMRRLAEEEAKAADEAVAKHKEPTR